MIFFTADTHFGHAKLVDHEIVYDNKNMKPRPFYDTFSMDQCLIQGWNSVVGPYDTVFHLGDVSISSTKHMIECVSQLNGMKFLVPGNHDHYSETVYLRAGFTAVFPESVFIKVTDKVLWLAHIPSGNTEKRNLTRPDAGKRPYDHALCGHVHDMFKFRDRNVNVGVDVWNFMPVTLDQILREIALKNSKKVESKTKGLETSGI